MRSTTKPLLPKEISRWRHGTQPADIGAMIGQIERNFVIWITQGKNMTLFPDQRRGICMYICIYVYVRTSQLAGIYDRSKFKDKRGNFFLPFSFPSTLPHYATPRTFESHLISANTIFSYIVFTSCRGFLTNLPYIVEKI